MIYPYLIGAFVYIFSVLLSYSDKAKASNWFFPAGLALALIANFLWLYIAKTNPDKHTLYYRALIWDCMIVLAYALVPVAMGVRLSGLGLLGVLLTLFGIMLTKLA